MGADNGLSLGELKVLPHEKVEQCRRLRLGGAGPVVAALEDLVAQAAAQVCLALEEGAGELQTDRGHSSKNDWPILDGTSWWVDLEPSARRA